MSGFIDFILGFLLGLLVMAYLAVLPFRDGVDALVRVALRKNNPNPKPKLQKKKKKRKE
jgi:hypothetical protein